MAYEAREEILWTGLADYEAELGCAVGDAKGNVRKSGSKAVGGARIGGGAGDADA